ncbi:MAG: phospho-sugar mutase [Ruminococcaceae bacterium]|nr:phospho-sugar mutase [Oscillospiraceae bacterium]
MSDQAFAQAEYERWCAYPKLDEATRQELLTIQGDGNAILMRFGTSMSFGTAGLRSTMCAGTACMNNYTVAQATQGIAVLIKREGGCERGVAVAYDSRNNSKRFAQVAAEVLAGNGIRVYLFDSVRPTPELSFAVRECGCMAGINITASHNPKEYNGYKAYWEDGAQLSPEHSRVVADAIAEVDVLGGAQRMPLDKAREEGLLTLLDESFDEVYLNAVMETAIAPEEIKKVSEELKIVYTPLHGAGYRLVPEILRRMGMKHLYTVPEQMVLDGNFPTVKKPNPEYANVFALGVAIAEREGSDLIIATDPDADRVGVMSRTANGDFATITGNQMGALLLDYVIRARRACGKLSCGSYAVKSIVSTALAEKIALANGVKLYDVFTGFKFIGEVIKNYEKSGKEGDFLLGFEESYGYLFGTYARDKDAVGATMMIVEMTAYYRSRGMTLSDALENLYKEYGLYKEGVLDLYMEGVHGPERLRRTMDSLRSSPLTHFAEVPIAFLTDHSQRYTLNLKTGERTPTGMEASNVLYYTLENGDKIIVRPSGTEPKIKFYFLCVGEDATALDAKIQEYQKAAEALTAV